LLEGLSGPIGLVLLQFDWQMRFDAGGQPRCVYFFCRVFFEECIPILVLLVKEFVSVG